ncbi:MAG: hypothetical protein LRZ84_20755 [Desertifilum sp.]|nr:hypothetical protein [Desertifilum sp.]MDI9639877.1 hypothetical protein [Geitlerinema splendidum]
MNHLNRWLRNRLRQAISVCLIALTFLAIPAFGYTQSIAARANVLFDDGSSQPVTTGTVKRIQDKAEDLGDAPNRRIGDTGLKNIRELPENIPETIQKNVDRIKNTPNRPMKNDNVQEAIDDADRALDKYAF